jgi:5-methylcytosine-specific restriction endonuclease McrA
MAYKDLESQRAYKAAWRAANRDKARASHAKWVASNREQFLAYQKAYSATHRKEKSAWRAANPEKCRRYRATYCSTHREEILARYAAQKATHPEKIRARNASARAVRPWLIDPMATVADLEAIKEIYQKAMGNEPVCCYLCGNVIPTGERNVDHIVPRSKGGKHTASNLAIAHASCNARKGAKMPEEFGLLL